MEVNGRWVFFEWNNTQGHRPHGEVITEAKAKSILQIKKAFDDIADDFDENEKQTIINNNVAIDEAYRIANERKNKKGGE